MKDLIAYCGLDCSKCDAYIATITNDNSLRETTAKLWSKMNNVTITPEMINCYGCRTKGIKTPYCENMCTIRQCALQKQISTCADCQKMNSCNYLDKIIANNKEAKNNLQNK